MDLVEKKFVNKTAGQLTVMTFGLCDASSTFERFLERVLHGIPLSACLLYLDDILLQAKTFQLELVHLQIACDKLKAANLKLNTKKCELFH